MQLLIDGVRYNLWTPQYEDPLVDIVKEHAKDIFGEDSIYFSINKTLRSQAGIGSKPDGYVIALSDIPQWYIVEVELSWHPLFEHIVSQMAKFSKAVGNLNTQRLLVNATYHEIRSDASKERLVQEKIGAREIHEFLSNLISGPPTLVVIIERKTPDLEEALSSIPLNAKVVECKTFEREGVGLAVHAHLFEPLYQPIPIMSEESPAPIEYIEDADTIVVPALEEGFKEVFLGENCWYKIRIAKSMLDKIKYVAGYQTAPTSAVTHYAEVSKIERYPGTDKFILYFKEPAKEIGPIKLVPSSEGGVIKPPYGPRYTTFNKLTSAKNLDELF